MVREILLLGDERLYQACREVSRGEAPELACWVEDLHDTLLDYRARHGAGRAVAAPQIGVMRRLIYMLTDRPYVFVNPRLSFPDGETCELLDDCMSFPGLLVRVRRHCRAVIDYLDGDFSPRRMQLEGDLSELLQHEYDHLDGILATMRAVDSKSFYMRELKRDFSGKGV